MSTWIMTPELRATLLAGIDGEGWDEAYKVRMRFELAKLSDGMDIPTDVSFSFPAADPDSDDPMPAVASMIEYFGITHLAGVDYVPEEMPTESWLYRNPG